MRQGLSGDKLTAKLEQEQGESMKSYLSREYRKTPNMQKIGEQLKIDGGTVKRMLIKYKIPIKNKKPNLYRTAEKREAKALELKEEHDWQILPHMGILKEMGYGHFASAISNKEKSWHDFRLRIGEKEEDIWVGRTITDKGWLKRFQYLERVLEENPFIKQENFVGDKMLSSVFQSPFIRRNLTLIREIFNIPSNQEQRKQYEFEKNLMTNLSIDYIASKWKLERRKELRKLLEKSLDDLDLRERIIVWGTAEGYSLSEIGKSLGYSRARIGQIKLHAFKRLQQNDELQKFFLNYIAKQSKEDEENESRK